MKKIIKIANNLDSKTSESGITIIALVITIVVLLIIASISINMGSQELTEGTDRKLKSELGMVNHALLEKKVKVDLTGESYPGTQIQNMSEVQSIVSEINSLKTSGDTVTLKDTEAKNYYLIETEEQFNKLGIKSSNYKYIVNYKTGEVINKDILITPSGEPLYTYSVDNT